MPSITEDPPTLDDVIRLYVIGVCVACNWNLDRTARVLDVSVKSVYNWLHKYQREGFLVCRSVKQGAKRTVWELNRRRAA